MTNGIMYSVATGGDRVYLGGKFKSLRRCPTGVTCPDGTIKTVNVGALNATTGEGCGRSRSPWPATAPSSMPSPSWTASCTSVASSRRSTNGPRTNLAAVDATTEHSSRTSHPVGSTTDDYVRGMLARRHALHRRQVQDRRRLHETAARRLQRRRCAQRHVAHAPAASPARSRPRATAARSSSVAASRRRPAPAPLSRIASSPPSSTRPPGVGPVGDGRQHLVGDVGLRPRRHL